MVSRTFPDLLLHSDSVTGVPCLRIDQGQKESAAKRFKNDPALRVLLLHGLVTSSWLPSNFSYPASERENAGLNVTCASRVFLVESVVHHGFEIQGAAE